MPLPSMSKAAHSGFETQKTSLEVQNRGIGGPMKKDLCPLKAFLKNDCVLIVVDLHRQISET